MKAVVKYDLKKVQITCPNCQYEFPYNKEYLEKKIQQLGLDIKKINDTLTYINNLPEEKRNIKEIKRLEQNKENIKNLLSDYKLERETMKQFEDKVVLSNLKIALREIGGEELYKICMDRALRDSKAYKINEMMNVKDYTHNDGGSLQKITN